MTPDAANPEGIEVLRSVLQNRDPAGEIDSIISGRDEVLTRYGSLFDPANLDQLSAEEFKGFLLFDNNHHWKSIHRQQTAITSDMPALREGLRLLQDETIPIEQRLDQLVIPGQANLVRGLGRAILTPILLIVYPDRYGVWNSIAEKAMQKLGLWPELRPDMSFGNQYVAINTVLNDTAVELGVDLWTLDALWWGVEMENAEHESDHGPNYWLFQGNPKVWDVAVELTDVQVGDEDTWSVSRFGDEMKPGDGVVIWSAGKEAGIYALGEITGEVFQRPTSGYLASSTDKATEAAIEFRYRALLEEPIPKTDLREHPILKDLTVIKAPQGTNFRVTQDQWRAIAELEKGEPVIWWVNQGETYEVQKDDASVWAPVKTRGGRRLQHWSNVLELRPDDVILHYANGAIRAIGRVSGEPGPTKKASAMPADWQDEGNGCGVDYFELARPIALGEIPIDLRSVEFGPFTKAGGVKQGYLFGIPDELASSIRAEFVDRWPTSSPWGSHDQAIHLVFKWNIEREPRTVMHHKEVEDRHGSVWWGKFGSGTRSALSAKNLAKIRDQIDREATTLAVLYRPGEVWLSNLLEITDDPAEVDDELLPSYYTKDECELFVRLKGLREVEDDWPLKNLVLASNPDPEKMPGALGNQRTPLMVNLRSDVLPISPVVSEELTMEWLIEQTLWTEKQLEPLIEALRGLRPQIVLAGPPGTGKTWVAKHVARYLAQDGSAHQTVQFHPSYGYEEFIEGLRPVVKDDGALTFEVTPGIVRQMVEQMDNPDQIHVLVIDEMNRANLSRVFGELMYLFEYRDDPINLQYTNDFELPANLVFIGTMNTADRSIRSIDIALRRRFDVFECPPDPEILRKFYSSERKNDVSDLVTGFESLNAALEQQLDRHHTIGHTFFMEPHMTAKRLGQIWDRQLKPLIEEYFFDQPDIAREFTLDRFWTPS